MKITLSSVFVDDQEKALKFYTEILGFEKKTEIQAGAYRWLTVASPEGVHGVELHHATVADGAAARQTQGDRGGGQPVPVAVNSTHWQRFRTTNTSSPPVPPDCSAPRSSKAGRARHNWRSPMRRRRASTTRRPQAAATRPQRSHACGHCPQTNCENRCGTTELATTR